MKPFKIFAILGILMVGIAIAWTPPEPPPNKYAYGFRKAVTLTVDDTITIAPDNYTLTVAALSADTNTVINTTVARSIIGDEIMLKVTADATNRLISFTGNVTAINDSVLANKTKVFSFRYDGAKFIQTGEVLIN